MSPKTTLPEIDSDCLADLRRDYETFSVTPLPRMLEEYVLDQYGIDLSSSYAGRYIRTSFGKASGQLSNALHQVKADAEAGLGFCVLKTVIAVDATGGQSMSEWAIPVTRMQVEPIVGNDGSSGWTVSWKGRGWHDTFETYIAFFDESLAIGKACEMLVVPSVKYHLPASESEEWRIDEYRFTTRELVNVWRRHYPNDPMPIEKDFSPTLAGDDRSKQKEMILEWIRNVPGLIKAGSEDVVVGLKIFNAMFEDEFQIELLRTAIDPGEDRPRADFLIYANRLFDPTREFDGKRGIAYGGPDLSARNLRMLQRLRDLERRGEFSNPVQPISATGDIDSGRKAVEYELLGCTSFQMHTLFQLPHSCFAKKNGSRIEKAIHHLLFHPETGYIAWKKHKGLQTISAPQ